jgi:uncharacterized spore protein YtfJ
MVFEDMVERVQQAIDVRRVFGEPYVRDGVTVIPVAAVGAGAGGGSGDDPERGGKGEGGGFGGRGRPIGAYVITDGRVSWQPAVDVTRLAVWGNIVLIVLILTVSRGRRRRRRSARKA